LEIDEYSCLEREISFRINYEIKRQRILNRICEIIITKMKSNPKLGYFKNVSGTKFVTKRNETGIFICSIVFMPPNQP